MCFEFHRFMMVQFDSYWDLSYLGEGGLGLHLEVIRAYSSLCLLFTQGLFLVGFKGHRGCWELNPGQM